MPLKFWSYSVLLAAFIINRLPTVVLKWRSPYEVLFNKSVDYSRLKPFGCLAYAANTCPHKSKFAERASKCVFLGYVTGQKGYQLYDIESGQIFVSRDVVFFDSIFPFLDNGVSSSKSLPDTYTQKIPDLNISSESPKTKLVPPDSRRGKRQTSTPTWLKDYVCEVDSQSYSAFMGNISTQHEPLYYKDACIHLEWVEAMKKELEALEKNHTWELTTLPPGKKAIGCKWVYKIKRNPDGTIDRFKARLVAKGYNQVHGIDYLDSFGPVAKALPGQVCRLVRSLYGLKQASREWNIELCNKLSIFGLIQSKHDSCLFTMTRNGGFFGYVSLCGRCFIDWIRSFVNLRVEGFFGSSLYYKRSWFG